MAEGPEDALFDASILGVSLPEASESASASGSNTEPDSQPHVRTRASSQAVGAQQWAPELPIAKVLVETPVPHLDRPFDYAVLKEQDEQAVVGSRVRVVFAGRRVNGFIVERVAEPGPEVKPRPLTAVLSPLPVLQPEVLNVAERVAERYAGTLSDVVRSAVAPRVARIEKEDWAGPAHLPVLPSVPDYWSAAWGDEDPEGSVVKRLMAGAAPRAVVAVTPGQAEDATPGWATRVATAAAATLVSGRGSVLVVPDAKDLDVLADALDAVVGPGQYARLCADDGPSPRYRAFLQLVTGQRMIAIGTRSAALAPVRNLGLVGMWDDHDASHVEQRAPYHHAREVLLLRAESQGTAAVFASPARSAEAQRLVETEWAESLVAPRHVVRKRAPWVRATSDSFETERDPLLHAARMPRLAFSVARAALETGPVLVQVARTGFIPVLRCQNCRIPARCSVCDGPLGIQGSQQGPRCGWCGRFERDFHCPECGGRQLRAGRVGANRTAEELGRAFPGIPMIKATGADPVDTVDAHPAMVIATPGAEPRAKGGYAAALILDADTMLATGGLRSGEDVIHRWFAASSLVVGRERGGNVVLTGHPSSQGRALVRWDAVGMAATELAERAQVGLPPAVRFATVTGQASAADAFVQDIEKLGSVRVVGPTREHAPPQLEGDQHRWILFFDHVNGPTITHAMRHRKALGSLRRDPKVTVRVDDPHAL